MSVPTYQYPSLQSIINDRLAYGIDASKIVGELTGVTIDSSFINGLAAVATGGTLATSSLTGIIDSSNLDYSNLNSVLNLASVATGGTLDTNLLSGTIDASSISGIIDSSNLDYSNLNSVLGLASVATGGTLAVSSVTGLASVATSGSYADLFGTPSLAPVATGGTLAVSSVTGLASVATSGQYGHLSGTPSLATVATSGMYSSLSGKPNLANVATGGSLDASLINGPIPSSKLAALSITPGTFYICPDVNQAPTKMIQGSTNPALRNFAVAQCVKFANAPQEYYNTVDAPCTKIVTDAPNAYITCLEIIIGISSLSFTDVPVPA
jgi:hypothetical protein